MESMTTVRKKNVEKANRSENPLEAFPDVFKYTSPGGRQYTLYCRRKGEMDAKVLKWAFKLTERNVSAHFEKMKMGWQPKVKQTELNKNWARYLVALDENRTPVAYTMFRFDVDYLHSVLFCHEIEVEPAVRRQGLGKFMLQALERSVRHWQIEKLVVTVPKNNEVGLSFFKANGYKLEFFASDAPERDENEVLSKNFK